MQKRQSPTVDGFTVGLILWFATVVVRAAWQCDDAYITFRTSENLWEGLGLVWNPGERVQVFTSPLWMFIAALCRAVSGEVYFSTLVASIVLAVAAAYLIGFRLLPDRLPAALVLFALSASAAVVDYATSGLENVLLYPLLLLLLIEVRREGATPRVMNVALLTSLLALTRPDAVLFAVPVLAWASWRAGPRSAARGLIPGLIPIVAWEIFSLIYYGSFIPNTALAKLNLEIPSMDLARRSLDYFADSAHYDPITLGLVVAGVAGSLWKGRAGERFLAMGVVLYLLFIVRIGGDFMSGRFFAAPAVVSAGLLVAALPVLTREGSGGRRQLAAVVAAVAIMTYGLAWTHSPWLSGLEYGMGKDRDSTARPGGIADERKYYYPTTGLLRILRYRDLIAEEGLPLPPYRGAVQGREFANSPQRVRLMKEVGFYGYFAGSEKTVIDVWALTDPLLARIPFRPEGEWRIGHYERRVPKGYEASVATGSDRFVDREIATFYRSIRIVTRGPLFTWKRCLEIWRLNAGYYDRILERPDYV